MSNFEEPWQRLIHNIAVKRHLPETHVRLILMKISNDEKLTDHEKEVGEDLGLGLRDAANSTGNINIVASLDYSNNAKAKGLQPLTQQLSGDAAFAAANGVLEIDWVMEMLTQHSADKDKQTQTFYALAYLLFDDDLWPWPHDTR